MIELERLREENQRLRDRVEELEATISSGAPRDVRIFGLAPQPSRILAIIAGRQIVTREAIWATAFSGDIDDRPEIKVIDVQVCRIRKAIAPHGLKIETVYGVGFKMSAEDREAVKREIEKAKEAA